AAPREPPRVWRCGQPHPNSVAGEAGTELHVLRKREVYNLVPGYAGQPGSTTTTRGATRAPRAGGELGCRWLRGGRGDVRERMVEDVQGAVTRGVEGEVLVGA